MEDLRLIHAIVLEAEGARARRAERAQARGGR